MSLFRSSRPLPAAIDAAMTEFMDGGPEGRGRARQYLEAHSGQMQQLPVGVLRELVSGALSTHIQLEILGQLRSHPKALHRTVPVLVHMMRYAPEAVAVAAAEIAFSSEVDRELVSVVVALMSQSRRPLYQKVAETFVQGLRGAEDISQLQLASGYISAFKDLPGEDQAQDIAKAGRQGIYLSEKAMAQISFGLTFGAPLVRNAALDALLVLRQGSLTDAGAMFVEALAALHAKEFFSEYSPRKLRDAFAKLALDIERSVELGSVLMEIAKSDTKRAFNGEITTEIPVKCYHVAASLMRGQLAEATAIEAIDALSLFFDIPSFKVLTAVSKRLAHLSGVLPGRGGKIAVEQLCNALLQRLSNGEPAADVSPLVSAIQYVSGCDELIVGACGRMLAINRKDATDVAQRILTDRIDRITEEQALSKAQLMLKYICPTWKGLRGSFSSFSGTTQRTRL